jgi:hypothetical protein
MPWKTTTPLGEPNLSHSLNLSRSLRDLEFDYENDKEYENEVMPGEGTRPTSISSQAGQMFSRHVTLGQ